MSDFFRKYWFVCLLGVCFLGVLIYFIADMNKDNVSSKSANGQDVVASTDLGVVTADDLLKDADSYSSTILYNMYRNTVVDKAVEADSAMKKEAKTMSKNVEANMDSDATGATKVQILAELASYGFEGDNALYNYALTASKIQKLDKDYVVEHADDLADLMPEGARTISLITMTVPNADVLSDESEQTQTDIQEAIDAETDFAEIAKEYSDDEATKENGGYYGYIDSSTTDLDSTVIEAVTALDKGEITDWISTTDSDTGMTVLYRVKVEETDAKAILTSDNEDDVQALVNTMVSSVSGLEAAAVQQAASGMTIEFGNDDVKKAVEDYIEQQTALLPDALKDSTKEDSGEDSSEEASANASSQASSQAASSVSDSEEASQ